MMVSAAARRLRRLKGRVKACNTGGGQLISGSRKKGRETRRSGGSADRDARLSSHLAKEEGRLKNPSASTRSGYHC